VRGETDTKNCIPFIALPRNVNECVVLRGRAGFKVWLSIIASRERIDL